MRPALDIARQAAWNLVRRYALDWDADTIDDAIGWGALAQVEAAARIAAARLPERYAFGVAQREIITQMLRTRQKDAALPLTMDMPAPDPSGPSSDRAALLSSIIADAQACEVYAARLDGLTRGQIAARMDLDFWAVHRILQRCRKQLQRRLAA
jgi:DNA-directed RNA polymerase specialized sigma24 family protein